MARGYRKGFVGIVRDLALSGISTNAEIGAVLRRSEAQIRNYRRVYPEFDEACELTLIHANVAVTKYTFKRAQEDDTMARYWNDRRNPAFMPKQKLDHTSNGNTLKALLDEHGRMDEEEARERGLIRDADESVQGFEDDEPDTIEDEPEDLDEFDEDGRPIRRKARKKA